MLVTQFMTAKGKHLCLPGFGAEMGISSGALLSILPDVLVSAFR